MWKIRIYSGFKTSCSGEGQGESEGMSMAVKTDLSTLERMAKEAEPGVLANAVL